MPATGRWMVRADDSQPASQEKLLTPVTRWLARRSVSKSVTGDAFGAKTASGKRCRKRRQ